MSFEKRPSTTASMAGVGSLKVSAGDITLDSTWSPYGQSQITVPNDAGIAEAIRPFSNPRCKILASDGDTFRSYNLVVRGREVSYDKRTIALTLATDERLLQEYSPITQDGTPREHEANLRDLVNYVLGRAIPQGEVATEYRRNHWSDPVPAAVGLANGVYRWSATETHMSVTLNAGTALATCTTTNATNPNIARANNWGTAGGAITPGNWVLSAVVERTAGLPVPSAVVWFYNSTGGQVTGSKMFAGVETDGRAAWQISVPTGAVTVAISLRRPSGGHIAGDWYRISKTMLAPAGAPGEYFHGGQAPDRQEDFYLTYAYAGTAAASASIEYRTVAGAVLQPGAVTADLTAHWSVNNEVTNPRAVNDAADWRQGIGATAVTRQVMTAPLPPIGTTAIRVACAAGGANLVVNQAAIRVTPGRRYFWSFWIATGTTSARTVQAAIQWWTANSTKLMSSTISTAQPMTVGAFQRVVVSAVPPPGAESAIPYVRVNGTAAGEFHYVTMAQWSEVSEDIPYFDGDTPADPGYVYTWSGLPHDSVSTRNAIIERQPELFEWRPGVTAWDFLAPLLAASGLRLFCDEKRRWFLVNPATYEVSGRLSVRPGTTVTGEDSIDADTGAGGFSGVVVNYNWRDPATGENMTAVDAAGAAGRIKVLDFDTPYPGPGVADAHLRKLSGQGRVQTVTVGIDLTTQPGQEISISLPGTNDQVGRVSRVQWTLGDEALMTVESSGLIEATPGSWLQGYNDLTWSTTPDIETWANQP